MKKFICGLITGLLIATSFTAFAVTKNIKKASFNNDTSVTVDGKPTSIQLVAVTLEGDQNGSNYGPVRGIVEAMGGKIEYDPKAKNIDIQTQPTKEGNDVSEITEKPKSTPDGITQIDAYQGKYYVGTLYINNKIKANGYRIIKDSATGKWQLIKGKYLVPNEVNDYTVVMDNVSISDVYGYDQIEYSYYVNVILPLIK